MLNKGCVTVTLQNFGGILEGIEPSVSFKNKDVFPLHYKIWGVESWEDSNLHCSFFKGERDTITLQDYNVLQDLTL